MLQAIASVRSALGAAGARWPARCAPRPWAACCGACATRRCPGARRSSSISSPSSPSISPSPGRAARARIKRLRRRACSPSRRASRWRSRRAPRGSSSRTAGSWSSTGARRRGSISAPPSRRPPSSWSALTTPSRARSSWRSPTTAPSRSSRPTRTRAATPSISGTTRWPSGRGRSRRRWRASSATCRISAGRWTSSCPRSCPSAGIRRSTSPPRTRRSSARST